jgi:hypothetical protein
VESQSWAGAAAKLRQKLLSRLTCQGGSPLRDWVPTKYLERRTRADGQNNIYVYDDARQMVQDTNIGLGQQR